MFLDSICKFGTDIGYSSTGKFLDFQIHISDFNRFNDVLFSFQIVTSCCTLMHNSLLLTYNTLFCKFEKKTYQSFSCVERFKDEIVIGEKIKTPKKGLASQF